MKPVLLIDFGSTFTKLTAIDVDEPRLLGTAGAHTTVDTGLGDGLAWALTALHEEIGMTEFAEQYACSSAAGGLRMVASGLVPELTARAAKQAALGAGAKLVKSFAYELTEEDIREIETIRPDIFLLTGGTDGGNTACILHNAKMLAACREHFPVVLAGNRSCAGQCEELLAGWDVYRAQNVMPTLDKLNVEPVQACIREIFLRRIVHAKGLDKALEQISGILMPTPAAVLDAIKLLADGYEAEPGLGEVVAIDVGGATTDVYSVAQGAPRQGNTVLKGIGEPYAKRTVEGDIGMRYSARGIADEMGINRLAELAGADSQTAQEMLSLLLSDVTWLPGNTAEQQFDTALASCAVAIAMKRHAGTLEKVFTPMGEAYMQNGKDLRGVGTLIITGGAVIHSADAKDIARHALYSSDDPTSLRPQQPDVLVDRSYILSAMGLLVGSYPQAALKLMKSELK